MKRLLSAVIATTMASVLIAGCAPAPGPGPGPGPRTTATATPAPTVAPSPATATPTPEPSTRPVPFKVYFAYNEKMQPAARIAPAGTSGTLRTALGSLLAGPTASEHAAGLVTLIPAGTKLLSVTISANVAIIDLDAKFGSGGGTLSMTDRIAQVVYTATQFSGIKAVTFKVDGKAITSLGGEGIIVTPPRTRNTCEGETPAILVDRPAWRGALKSGEAISGTANVFEATFRLEVRDAAGTLVYAKTVHATSGTGTRGTWTVTPTLSGAKAGIGSIRVFEPSAKDGSPTNVVKVPVIIEP
jgi:hypothetical protein